MVKILRVLGQIGIGILIGLWFFAGGLMIMGGVASLLGLKVILGIIIAEMTILEALGLVICGVTLVFIGIYISIANKIDRRSTTATKNNG